MDFSSFFDYEQASGQRHEKPQEVFLGELGEADWTRFPSVTQRRSFVAGEVLLRQGEISRAFYIVASGRLEVYAEGPAGEQHISDIEALSVFGEQAFVDGLPRSASIRAHQPGELFIMSLEAFEVLSARHPDLARRALMDLCRILSLRLRDATRFVLQTQSRRRGG